MAIDASYPDFSASDFLGVYSSILDDGWLAERLAGINDPPAVLDTIQYIEQIIAANDYLPVSDLDIVTTLSVIVSSYVVHGEALQDSRRLVLVHLAASIMMHVHATGAGISGTGTAYAPLAMCQVASVLGPVFLWHTASFLLWHRHRVTTSSDSSVAEAEWVVFIDLAIRSALTRTLHAISGNTSVLLRTAIEVVTKAEMYILTSDLGGHAAWAESLIEEERMLRDLSVEAPQFRDMLIPFAEHEHIYLTRWRSRGTDRA